MNPLQLEPTPRAVRRARGGPYELRGEIGAGGVARVYRAVDKSDPWASFLALKVLRSTFAKDPQQVAHLHREAELVAALEHPNVVKVVDYGITQGRYALVMEYVHGLSLGRLMKTLEQRRMVMPMPIALHLAIQALSGLAYVHTRPDGSGPGLVHRDVSPGNVLVDYRGKVKLIDFGLAREAQAPVTNPGRLRGKVGYLSPEQARGERVDARSDLFSLGVVLAELVLQRRLFQGDGPTDIVERVLRADLSTLDRLADHVPAELEFILRVALDADPEERFQTAIEFREALVDFAEHTAFDLPRPREAGKWLTVNRVIAPISGTWPAQGRPLEGATDELA